MRALVLAGSLLAAATPQPALALSVPVTSGGTHCRAVYDDEADPGLSTTGRRITVWTQHPGSIRCDGPVLGHPVKGTGTVTNISRLGIRQPADCVNGGDGVVTLHITLPGHEGPPQELFEAGELTFGGLANGLVNGKFSTEHTDATFTVVPLKGDCLTKPVTRGRVTVEMTVHPARGS